MNELTITQLTGIVGITYLLWQISERARLTLRRSPSSGRRSPR